MTCCILKAIPEVLHGMAALPAMFAKHIAHTCYPDLMQTDMSFVRISAIVFKLSWLSWM